jgi:hypothetical protein
MLIGCLRCSRNRTACICQRDKGYPDGALADERDGHGMGAHGVACDAAGGVEDSAPRGVRLSSSTA